MGSLSFKSITQSAAAVNLSAITNVVDWAVWPSTASAPTPSDHKSGAGSTIALALFGAGGYSGFSPDPRTVSWASDGTTAASGSFASCQLNGNSGVGSGFTLTFPADTTARIAYIYGGMYQCIGAVAASLSDSSATAISDTTSQPAASGLKDSVIAIAYQANSAGQHLTVNLSYNGAGGFSGGLAYIQAAAHALGAASGAALQGAATDSVSGAGALITAIKMASGAADAISAAATFTVWSTVTLAAPLYTGTGGALDPTFWVDNVPVVGDTLEYDGTNITIAPSGEIVSTTNNTSAVVQFNDGTGNSVGLITITPLMVANALDITVATGDLGSAPPTSALAGDATDTVTASGILLAGAQLAGAASSLVTAAGVLSTQINMLGAAVDASTAQASLTIGASLAGNATDATTSAALLSTSISLQAAATDLATATAALTTAIQILGAGTDTSVASGALTSGAGVTGSANDSTAASGSLSTAVQMGAAALSVVTAIGALTTHISLLGTASDQSTGAADLLTGIPLAGSANDATASAGTILVRTLFASAAVDLSTATGDIQTQINLLASALDTSTGSGTITTNQTAVGLYSGDPGFVVSMRTGTTPTLPEMSPYEAHVVTFDFSDELVNGEILTGIASVTVSVNAGVDPTPLAVLNGQPSYDVSLQHLLQPIIGASAVVGNNYYLVAIAKTSNPLKILARYALLPIRD